LNEKEKAVLKEEKGREMKIRLKHWDKQGIT